MSSNPLPRERSDISPAARSKLSESVTHLLNKMGRSSEPITASLTTSNLGKLLKSNPLEAELSNFTASAQRLNIVPSEPSFDEDAMSSSQSSIITPRSLLFQNSTDIFPTESGVESRTLGSSWSSCSKLCGSYESQESAPTSCEEVSPDFESESELIESASAVVENDRIESVCDMLARQQIGSDSSTRRSRSHSGLSRRSSSWQTLHANSQKAHSSSLSSSSTSTLGQDSPSPDFSPFTSPTEDPEGPTTFAPDLDEAGPADLSAYVSGIGAPIDPDIEMSTFVQLQTFRSHARSRSVGRGDSRRERRLNQSLDRARIDERMANMLGLSPRKFHSMASPRPPLALIRDTEQIPELGDLGVAMCQPGYVLFSRQQSGRISASPTLIPTDNAPPASPVLHAPTESLEPIPDDAEMSLQVLSDDTAEEELDLERFGSKRPRREEHSVESELSDTSVSDVGVSDDEAFSQSHVNEDEDLVSEENVDDEDSRGRGRCTSVKSIEPKGSLNMVGCKLGVSHHRSSRRRKNHHTSSGSGSDYETKKHEFDLRGRDKTRGRGRDRGRGAAVKIVTSTNRPAEAKSHIPSPANMNISVVDAQDLPRSRLLSNSSHLLMLSLEVAMIQHRKIHAPLKPRWGKRRDDDFQPLPRMDSRVQQFMAEKKLRHVSSSVKTSSMYHYVDECGSRLKYNWESNCV